MSVESKSEGRRSCAANGSLDAWTRSGFDPEQHLVELDEVAVLDADLGDRAGHLGLDIVVELHRLDQADDGVRLDG